jgi:hypothetical protein
MYRLPLLLFINVTSTPSLPDQHFSFPDDRAATPTLNWHAPTKEDNLIALVH